MYICTFICLQTFFLNDEKESGDPLSVTLYYGRKNKERLRKEKYANLSISSSAQYHPEA